jgi:hypothetical protein
MTDGDKKRIIANQIKLINLIFSSKDNNNIRSKILEKIVRWSVQTDDNSFLFIMLDQ